MAPVAALRRREWHGTVHHMAAVVRLRDHHQILGKSLTLPPGELHPVITSKGYCATGGRGPHTTGISTRHAADVVIDGAAWHIYIARVV